MLKRFGVTVLLAIVLNLYLPAQTWSEAQSSTSQDYQTLNTMSFEVSPGVPDPNEVLKLVNKSRSRAEAPPLRANRALAKVAAKRASDMAVRQFYAHKNPDGQYFYDLFASLGISPDYSCENLDMVFESDNQTVINEWLGSTKGHRECMLNRTLIEAGYATTKLSLVDLEGKTTTAYLVVAIHATNLQN